MANLLEPKKTHPTGEVEARRGDLVPSGGLDTFGGTIHVRWDPGAAVTPNGQIAFFVEFLKTAGLWEHWVRDCPLKYTSPNAPTKVDVLGTMLLGVLAGHTRYAHVTAIRSDGVTPGLLGMERVVSEDSMRRAFEHADPQECAGWMRKHLRASCEPLLAEPWVLDIDTTVKPLYGHQEMAVKGYNPTKPGRPSHTYHTYFIGALRMVLDVEVKAGNQTAASHRHAGLWEFIRSLGPEQRPKFARGDCGWGNETEMAEAEREGMPYLFKLRMTRKVKDLVERTMRRQDWKPAGDGWQGVEADLQLAGWTRSRRVVVVRRQAEREKVKLEPKTKQLPLQFAEVVADGPVYDCAVLVTSLLDEVMTVAQHYRDRAGVENVFDELKNQWGWGGFTTRDQQRCQLMARTNALAYNWWSVFARLSIPNQHTEAVTSRPLLLHAIGRQVRHAGQVVLSLTSTHALAAKLEPALEAVHRFLEQVRAGAEQLLPHRRWAVILSHAFRAFLKGRVLGQPTLAPNST